MKRFALVIALLAVFLLSLATFAPAATAPTATKAEVTLVKKELNARVTTQGKNLRTEIATLQSEISAENDAIVRLEHRQPEKGERGATGPTGSTGAQGPQGERGETGATGPQGPAGLKGERGERGPEGKEGPPGKVEGGEEPPLEEPPVEEPTRSLNCFQSPIACGYPDTTTTGPTSGPLKVVKGSVNIGANQTVSGEEILGSVNFTGSNSKLVDSVVKSTEGGSGSVSMQLACGISNVTLESVHMEGNGSKTNSPESNVWNHCADSGFKIINSYLEGTPDNIEGPAEVNGSYIIVNAEYPGNHSEDMYLGGGQTASFHHDTLLNEHGETSVIFGDYTNNNVTVENSLLAGGGYTIGCNAKSETTGSCTMINNHFARKVCATLKENSGGGWECGSAVTDNDGYWPKGGQYGLSYGSGGKTVIWTGNVWDDNGATIGAP